jgi:hypothetical protein
VKPDPIQLTDKMAQPIGKLIHTPGGWRVGCDVCGWSTEANGLTAGTHLDELLDHLDEDH